MRYKALFFDFDGVLADSVKVKTEAFAKLFEEILGSGRTKTENLGYLLSTYAISPETGLFFGDAASDYRAAMNCGVDFLGILPGPDAPLLKTAPDIEWVHDFTEVDFLNPPA